jgi:hypothetical protein
MSSIQRECVLDNVMLMVVQHLDSLSTLNMLIRSCRTLAAHSQDVRLYLDIMMRMPCMSKQDLRQLLVMHNNDEIPRLQGVVLLYGIYMRFAVHGKYSSPVAHYCCPAEALQVALLKHGSLTGISRAYIKRRARNKRSMRRTWLRTLLRLHNVVLSEVQHVPTIQRFLRTGTSFEYVFAGSHSVQILNEQQE